MKELRLRATLGANSSYWPAPKEVMTYLTRSATGTINYNLSFCNYKDIDELIFVMKQGKTTYCYTMIDYLKETADEEFLDGKDYYNILEVDPETNECAVELIEDRTGSPAGYYELDESKTCTKANNFWVADKHFNYNEEENIITLVLSAEETAQFKPTVPDDNIRFEINLRVGETVIIEPQMPIAVLDSLSSKI